MYDHIFSFQVQTDSWNFCDISSQKNLKHKIFHQIAKFILLLKKMHAIQERLQHE